MARYLITGVAGFIGSWIARDLVARGETVRGLDNLSTGKLENLEGIENCIEFVHADLRNAKAVEAACKDVDYIFHEAAIASVQQSIDDPVGTSNVNLGGTLNLIAAAQKHRIKRIVFASSSAVYGNRATGAIAEDAPPAPLSPYAIQKLSCEQYLGGLWALAGVEAVCLRYFNVFGPRQAANSPYSGVIAKFSHCMIEKPDCSVLIYGDGQQSRDFVFISDVVHANLQAMHAPAEAVAGQVFNIGTGRASTVRLTFETIACLVGYTGDPTHLQERPGDIRESLASILSAQQAFGYNPRTSLTEGLQQTVAWYRASIQAAAASVTPPQEAVRVNPRTTVHAPQSSVDRHISARTFMRAIQNGELELFYQPILGLHTMEIAGVEALLRWRSGSRILTPAHFIHLVEEKHLFRMIGPWALEQACRQGVNLQKQLGRNLRVAVNIAPAQLERRDFLREVDLSLSLSGLPSSCLDLEVTERALLRDCSGTQDNLKQLRKRGIRIAVDDFGVGYSNMNYLYRFPIDSLKIDQSFVRHRGHARILDGIVAFARTLGVRTVAEGVETAHHLEHVRACECDEAQGYHIGRPVPADQLVQAIRSFEAPFRQVAEARNRFHELSLAQPFTQVRNAEVG